MKLLREFFLRAVDRATGAGRVPQRAFSVTVPAPLLAAADGALAGMPCASDRTADAPRREPASFLKAARHRRPGGAR